MTNPTTNDLLSAHLRELADIAPEAVASSLHAAADRIETLLSELADMAQRCDDVESANVAAGEALARVHEQLADRESTIARLEARLEFGNERYAELLEANRNLVQVGDFPDEL